MRFHYQAADSEMGFRSQAVSEMGFHSQADSTSSVTRSRDGPLGREASHYLLPQPTCTSANLGRQGAYCTSSSSATAEYVGRQGVFPPGLRRSPRPTCSTTSSLQGLPGHVYCSGTDSEHDSIVILLHLCSFIHFLYHEVTKGRSSTTTRIPSTLGSL